MSQVRKDADHKVCERWGDGGWIWNWRRDVRGGIEQEQLENMLSILMDIQVQEGNIQICWSLDGQTEFTVAGIRRHIDAFLHTSRDMCTLWCNSVPKKVNVFAWEKIKTDGPVWTHTHKILPTISIYVKKDDDRDEEAEYSPFAGIEKGAVLQEARVFNDPQLDPRRCSQVITKLLYLLNQVDTFTKNEATEVFFAVTKLFQSRYFGLKRMVYLIIKELSPSSDEVIIVTSSLMKDMNSKTDVYRANAIRVLCRITDGTLLTQIERYLKQAIVGKNPVVASAALVSGIHWLKSNPEIVKRWSNEVQEAVQSRAALVQFHALGLLHQIRQNDRLAVSKLVSSLTKGTVIRESSMNSQTGDPPFYDYLEGCLRHKAAMVIFEAARAITELSGVTSRELTPAITVLQLFLSSSKPVLRFAAVRTLNKVAMTHPMAVTSCNIDMESLISDQNRSIATLAITTLLKTGNESGVDRLMKQITNFMSDIADEFKIVVKFRTLMNFLSNILREEGGFEYKKAIVDSIVTIIRDIPDAKESGLLHLCEFIEDSEFTYLSTQILHFFGIEGPKTSDPSKFIRYIYNRVILENATVRASAVSTLAKFGAMVELLKPRIFVLLRRCLYDNDDEAEKE
nr:coatomer subunit gamma-2 [Tanacetum cinerariifolium]